MKDVKKLDLSVIDQIVQLPASEEMLTKPCGFVVEVRRLDEGGRTEATVIGVNAGTGVVVSDCVIRPIDWTERFKAALDLNSEGGVLFALDELGKTGVMGMATSTENGNSSYHFYIGTDAERLRFELRRVRQHLRMMKN